MTRPATALITTLVESAGLAPTVHNIQPALWTWDGETLTLSADPDRTIPVGDPEGRDVAMSLGAGLEGLSLAASAAGLSIDTDLASGPPKGEIARIRFLASSSPEDHRVPLVQRRLTWRGGFARACASQTRTLMDMVAERPDLCLLTDERAIEDIAEQNDSMSMDVFRQAEYRAELVHWMRFTRNHPNWLTDGLNARSMDLSGLEARLASIVMKPGVFDLVDRLGLAGLALSERDKTRSSTAIALFHRPADEDPVTSGRAFYRAWLNITAAGCDACPMAVLADDVDTRQHLSRVYGISDDRRLINVFRIGVPKPGRASWRYRRPVSEVFSASL